MTTLIGIQGDGWAVMGSDSRVSDSETGRWSEMSHTKIVENNGILIGGAGSVRGLNLLHYGWKAPKPRANADLDVFMTKTFIPALRECFVKSGYDIKEESEAAKSESHILVAVQGVLYPIYDDYSWLRDENNVYDFGSGSDIALGALEAYEIQKCKTPAQAEKLVKKAIEISMKHDMMTGGTVYTFVQEY